MKVAIAGGGGIGSNVAVNLLRAGLLELRLVDFDWVESSNLNRQYYFHDQIGKFKVDALRENLLRINPEARVETAEVQLDRSNFGTYLADCPVVVEGFDETGAKKMLLEHCGDQQVQVVGACGIAGRDMENIQVRTLGNATLFGDFTTDFRQAELYCPKIQMIAAMMADRVLQYVRGWL